MMQTCVQDDPRSKSVPDFPLNLLDFQRIFGDEAACLAYLEKVRWPDGFVCIECKVAGEPFRFTARPKVLKCRFCHQDSSVTAGTVMHRSKTSVLVWFWAAYLVATQTPGISALELQKKLGIRRYETAFQILHKLRGTMVRPERDKIGVEWPIELDVVFIGGKHKGGIQGKTYQTPVVIAVETRRQEVRDPKTEKVIKRALAGRIRLQMLTKKSGVLVNGFAQACIAPGAALVSDDGTEFMSLRTLGYDHRPIPMRGDREKMDSCLPMISRVTANLKTWLDGTFHGVRKKHLQAYLDEYMFRFNRRFYRQVSFRKLLELGTHQAGLTYREVYSPKPSKGRSPIN